MNTIVKLTAIGILLIFGACSDNDEREPREQVRKDHVWKDQVDMLDKAKGLEDMALDGAERRRKKIDNQGG